VIRTLRLRSGFGQLVLWGFLGPIALAQTSAPDPASLKPQGYVSDFAHVVAPQYKNALEQYCHAVKTATGAELSIVTVDTLGDEQIEDFTNSLFRKWGVGQKGKNEGLMLLLAIKDRKSRIEVGYGLEPVITDGVTGGILRDMRPLLRQANYGAAIFQAMQVIGSKIAAAHGTTIDTSGLDGVARRRVRRGNGSGGIRIGAIIFLIVVLALMSRGGRGGGGGGFLTGMLLGSLMGRRGGFGGGGFGGGGFGGYDGGGGGGFGGFGGGDSGGGGASSNW
jgi:uncharacterized protein